MRVLKSALKLSAAALFLCSVSSLSYARLTIVNQNPDAHSKEQRAQKNENRLFSDAPNQDFTYIPPKPRSYWIEAGVGGGLTGYSFGVGGGLALNYRWRKHLLTLQTTTITDDSELHLPILFFKTQSKKRFVKNMGVLYGRFQDYGWGFTSESAGLSYVKGRDANGTFSTFGIPITAEAMWTPHATRIFGIGGKLVGTVNGRLKESGIAAMLVIGIGKFH